MSSAADAMRDRPAPATTRAAGHKHAPDTVRAVAAVTVVVSHAIQIVWYPHIGLGNWTHWTTSFLSETAVIVFFVLSGYLITSSIGANIDRHGRFRVLEYALSRVIRIYPPLLCAIALSAALFAVMTLVGLPGVVSKLAFAGDLYEARETVTVTVDEIIDAITMRNGLLLINGPLWSLNVEIKLYLIAGLLAFCAFGTLPLLLRPVIVALVVWLAPVGSVAIAEPHWVYCAWWATGASLCLIFRLRDRAKAVFASVLCLSAGLILYLTPTGLDLEAARVLSVLLLAYGMFARWSWNEPLTKFVAGFSYTLYLVHFPILIFVYAVFIRVAGPDVPAATWRVAVMGIGVAVSFLSAWWIATLAEDTRRIKNALCGRGQTGQ